jgi:hypothetical protein
VYQDVSEIDVDPESHAGLVSYCSVRGGGGGGGRGGYGDCGGGADDDVNSRQLAADSRQQTADKRQQTADSRQETADSRQQTRDSRRYLAPWRMWRAGGGPGTTPIEQENLSHEDSEHSMVSRVSRTCRISRFSKQGKSDCLDICTHIGTRLHTLKHTHIHILTFTVARFSHM